MSCKPDSKYLKMASIQIRFCASCSQRIFIEDMVTIYKCGDAHVCSDYCSNIRLRELVGIDPSLSSPSLWQRCDNEVIYEFDVIYDIEESNNIDVVNRDIDNINNKLIYWICDAHGVLYMMILFSVSTIIIFIFSILHLL